MRKLIYCTCGCGERRRAPLPPLAERARRRRFSQANALRLAEAYARDRNVLEQFIRAHAEAHQQPAPIPETRH